MLRNFASLPGICQNLWLTANWRYSSTFFSSRVSDLNPNEYLATFKTSRILLMFSVDLPARKRMAEQTTILSATFSCDALDPITTLYLWQYHIAVAAVTCMWNKRIRCTFDYWEKFKSIVSSHSDTEAFQMTEKLPQSEITNLCSSPSLLNMRLYSVGVHNGEK